MATQARSSREEERRLSIRTLVIASVASLVAAVVTAQFWRSGTPIAAAMTPVIVAIVSEMLHKPSEKLAQKLTTDRTAVMAPPAEGPPAAGVPPPPVDPAEPPPPRSESQVKVYGPSKKRKFAWRIALVTGVLAFAIAAAVLTLPELIAGQSIAKSDRGTTIFGGRDNREDAQQEQDAAPADQQQDQDEPAQEPTEEPQQQTQPAPDETETETTPETDTTPAPQGGTEQP